MNRRNFIGLASVAAVGCPLIARGQQPALPVVGLLNPTSSDNVADRLRGFRQGLKEAGFIEGENVAIDYRWADNQLDRLPALAADLVRRRVAVIATTAPPATVAAKAATTSIPIIFLVAEDPVGLGLVASLARPGGNLTGVNILSAELVAKRLGLLHEAMPAVTRVAVLVNPTNATVVELTLQGVKSAAQTMGLQIQVVNASNSGEIREAFKNLARERTQALFVAGDPFFGSRRVQLVSLAAHHSLPASYPLREFAEAGGLMSYGADIADAFRQVGIYAGRVLRGAKPVDLPVLQLSKFELVINAETARMLDLAIPPSLLARADEVIE